MDDFYPLEKRHLGVSRDEIISGFAEESGWICAFKDVSPNQFGFVPKSYLKFVHRTNSQSVTPRSELGKSRDKVPSENGENVRNFLTDIYSVANEEEWHQKQHLTYPSFSSKGWQPMEQASI